MEPVGALSTKTQTMAPTVAAQHKAHDAQEPEVVDIIRHDEWETGLFSCLSSPPIFLMVWCVPCVPLAQISQRVGWASYAIALCAFVAMYFAELAASRVTGLYFSFWFDTWPFDFVDYVSVIVGSFRTYWFHFSMWDYGMNVGAFTFLGSVTGWVMVVLTWALRVRLRSVLDLPSSCFVDGFASVCCTCCTIAQMATHLQTSKGRPCNVGPVDTLPAFLP